MSLATFTRLRRGASGDPFNIKITSAGSLPTVFCCDEEHDSNNGEHNTLYIYPEQIRFFIEEKFDGFAKVFKITANGETIEQLSQL